MHESINIFTNDLNLRNCQNFRIVTSRNLGLETLELPDRSLQNFWTRSSGTSEPEPPELPDQNLQNFRAGTFGNYGMSRQEPFFRESRRKQVGSNESVNIEVSFSLF
jgi:hypothetical protein